MTSRVHRGVATPSRPVGIALAIIAALMSLSILVAIPAQQLVPAGEMYTVGTAV